MRKLGLQFGEGHKLRGCESMVLRKIFGAKMDEVTGEWRRLHNEEVHNLNSPPSDLKNEDEMSNAFSTYGGAEKCIPVSVGNVKKREHLD
jgi:hypothetical protein